jgi:hypothetical protein
MVWFVLAKSVLAQAFPNMGSIPYGYRHGQIWQKHVGYSPTHLDQTCPGGLIHSTILRLSLRLHFHKRRGVGVRNVFGAHYHAAIALLLHQVEIHRFKFLGATLNLSIINKK